MVVTREPEVLFEEARRRTRRRRRQLVAVVVAPVAGLAAAVVVLLAAGAARRHAAPDGRATVVPSGGEVVALKRPGPLAVSPSGTLYVVDGDRVLRLLPSGKFAVFAGDGRSGFSGDGGPATRAELKGVSTIAVGPGGTVYIADTGNNRVRAVAPDGTIRTLVRVSRPAGLAVGPHDRLYIEADDLFSMPLRGGRLRELAGGQLPRGNRPITNREIMESHFSGASADIAVDSAGDVFVANFPQLYERTAAGRLRFLGDGFRAGGGPGQLTDGPGDSVYEATFGVARISTAAPQPAAPQPDAPQPDAEQTELVRRPRSIVSAGRVDAAVGGDWRQLAKGRGGAILAPASGLAVGPDGTIYYDSDSGDGWASGALVEIRPSGAVRVLWRAPN